ncbi:Hydroxypyruvate isomerase [Rubellimicrobium thermophilum DSM 16684]|uniref:Hydroxypyruvate isomerase n=1 Tax=Rubellimicrobium thermophilum DSM 16684 TaxID=1123069 RepID=S9QU81_9RHOB|nr:TIM barrel protein [Rubellimicrobium thermophilum]EPX83198.1 Hydroxypyruvate isomerase [Rubellimicrobium thermophilum DSM 16684]
MAFQLSACAEMLWRDRPLAWRVSRLKEMGLGVGLWNWPGWDIPALEKTGATFTIMNGYLQGRLTDEEGCAMLLASAREAVEVGKRLGVQRLNLHGTGLGPQGIPIPQIGAFAPGMEIRARDTLHRLCDLAEAEGVTFTLENLNPIDHPGCPFGSTAAVLGLVSAVNRPQLRINLDLYHTQIGEGDLIRWCRACLPWIGEVQVADNPGRCEPGTGEINYRGIALTLTEMGYEGPVGLEAFARGDPETALETFRCTFTV